MRSLSVVDGMLQAPSGIKSKKGRRFSCPAISTVDNAIFIKRPPFTQVKFDELHLKLEEEEKTSCAEKLKQKCYCSKKRIWKLFTTFLPIVKVLRYYKIRENALIDVLSGITIGIMHIPQALAFGMLTSVKIENGLYTSLWPILLYVIFGTSPHVSMGTSAVICIVTASIVDRQADVFKSANPQFLSMPSFATNITGNATDEFDWEGVPEFMDYKEGIAMQVSFLSGAIMLGMGFLRLGFITAYLSESFFAAFTSGAAFHIATSQVPALLGLTIPRSTGIAKIVYTYINIFSHITMVNLATLIVAAVSIVCLCLVKECINERFKSKLVVPIPIELLIVIVATVVSYFIKLDDNFGVATVKHIPSGIQPPVLPSMEGALTNLADCFIVAILIFANTIAMAKICAKKHNYEVDDSQELIAYGMCNFASSFLKCFPSAVAPPRSMIASSMNTKTTIAGIFAAVLMFLLIMVMSSLFEPLPKSALAAIIIVALKGLFIQLKDCVKYWRINKFDFVIWIFTFVPTVFLDIDLGLGIGVIVSLITVVFQTQFARGFRIGRTMKDSVMVEHKRYSDSIEPQGVKIFRFQSNLFFANAEIFRNSLYRNTVNPRKLLKFLKKREKTESKLQKDLQKQECKKDKSFNGCLKASDSNGSLEQGPKVLRFDSDTGDSPRRGSAPNHFSAGTDNPVYSVSSDDLSKTNSYTLQQDRPTRPMERQYSMDSMVSSLGGDYEEDPDDGEELVSEAKLRQMRRVHHIILDCSTINYMDASGANVLAHIYTEYSHVNIKVFLACCSFDMRNTMKQAGTYDRIPEGDIFIELHDAVAVARSALVLPLPGTLEDFSEEEAAEDSYVTRI